MLLGCRIANREFRQRPSSGRSQNTRLDETSQLSCPRHYPRVCQLRRRYGITGAWYAHHLGSLEGTRKFFSAQAFFWL